MGRNARRTHNLKNKRGARRDEGGGGARRWPLREREREGEREAEWRRKRGKSLPGFSVGLHEFAGGPRGGEKGHISRASRRGETSAGLGWCWVGLRSGEERRWMYSTVNETTPLTTFGTDNGRECAAGVNEPKVVHRWVGSSLPRHGWGWVGLARLAIIASTIDLIALCDSPPVPSFPFFFSFPSLLSLFFVSSGPNSPATIRVSSRLDFDSVRDEIRRRTRRINYSNYSNHSGTIVFFFSISNRGEGKGTNARSLPHIPPLSPRRRRRPLCFATSPDVCHWVSAS